MNSRTDSSARHVRVKVAGQTRPYSCCVCPKQARQAQADTCTEMLPCRKFARVPVHVEWGGSFMLSGVGASGGRKFCRTCISCVSGGRGVRGSAFSVAWPAEEFPRCFKHILLFCSDGGLKILRAPETHLVEESMGVGGLHVHGGTSPGCDELSSWRSMNSRTDSSARHVRVKVAGQTRPYSCCVCPKQARQAQADTCTEMLPCRKFARVPVHVEWGGSFMLSGVGAA